MIQINKPDSPPEILRTDGKDKRRSHSGSFARNSGAFRRGDRTFSFHRSVYTDDSVKEALDDVQNGKCCFCESSIRHVTYGDVEHFRPKAGFRQTPDEELQRPGYYWLAYEWTNLFLCCPLCNRRFKKNLFPLRNPGERATSHQEDIEAEDPLFLHPERDDPERHIGFREAVAFARDGSERGGRTIAALQLNRDALYEVRKDYYDKIFKELIGLLRLLNSDNLTDEEERQALWHIQRILEQNRTALQQENTQYVAMLRDAVDRFEDKVPSQ